MAFKTKYRVYSKGNNKHVVNTGLTLALLELGVGIICLLFAYADWGNGKTMLYWPFIIVSGFCFVLVLYSGFEWIYINFTGNKATKIDEDSET